MSAPPQVVLLRRSFLLGLGLGAGGLGLGVLPAGAAPVTGNTPGKGEPSTWPALPSGVRPSVYVHIALDGVVTVICHRSEMGQGVRSTLHVLIADELGADPARVRLVQGDGDKRYGDQNTDGSSSIRKPFDELRQAGASLRTMLVSVAAKRWKVTPASCTTTMDRVQHTESGRSLAFAELVAEARTLPVPPAAQVKLRLRAELRHLGKDLPLRDGPDVVTGKAVFGADLSLPDMLVAVIARPPVAGGRVASFDATRAKAVAGVRQVIELPAPAMPFAFQPLGGVAVLATNTWAALRGRAALSLRWDAGPNQGYDSASYEAMLTAAVHGDGTVVRERGDVPGALSTAKRSIESVYNTPHLAHAPMEPPAALARFRDGACEVWATTQNPQAAQIEVARALGIGLEKVTVHVTLLGGGFGRKSKPDYVAEAALLSRAAGVPVRVQWTREDDIQHDYYHTTAAQRLVAGLDDRGQISAWQHTVAFPPIGSIRTGASMPGEGDLQQGVTDLPLAVANVQVRTAEAKAHTRIGWLRSVANIYHAFAVQSFIAELAHARGVDPAEQLREILGPARVVSLGELGVKSLPNYGQPLEQHPIDVGRHLRVLDRACELSRWSSRDREGRALGVAVHRSFLAYVAVVVELVRAADGKIRVDQAWIVADCGTIVNRERVRSQMEGAVMFGMSLALYGAITMRRGATVQSNFRDYRLLRMAEAPRAIHVDLIESERPPAGVGEPGVPPVAPAIGNALFALTGQRLRRLPFVDQVPV